MSEVSCPKCGSLAVKWGLRKLRKGKFQRYSCRNGHVFQEPTGDDLE